jgi:hypothetical protein
VTEGTDPVSRLELMEVLQAEKEQFDALISRLTADQMLEPGIEGDRSVKDLIAHMTAWEGKMIQWLDESLAGQVPQRPAPGLTWDDLDQINQQIYLDNRDKALDEVMSESASTYARALKAIQGLTDPDLFDGSRFAWRKGDPIWHMVAANTWWHYQEHRDQIEAWLSGRF